MKKLDIKLSSLDFSVGNIKEIRAQIDDVLKDYGVTDIVYSSKRVSPHKYNKIVYYEGVCKLGGLLHVLRYTITIKPKVSGMVSLYLLTTTGVIVGSGHTSISLEEPIPAVLDTFEVTVGAMADETVFTIQLTQPEYDLLDKVVIASQEAAKTVTSPMIIVSRVKENK